MDAFVELEVEDEGIFNVTIAPTLPQHLAGLDLLTHDEDLYARRFLVDLAQIGVRPRIDIDANGSSKLWCYAGADDHSTERSLRLTALSGHLDASGHREAVMRHVARLFQVDDRRPNIPAETTRIIRDAVAGGLRLLINPRGRLEVGPTIPHDWGRGDRVRDVEIERSAREYFLLWCRFAARRQIMRSVRLCGYRTDNGWLVLEAAK